MSDNMFKSNYPVFESEKDNPSTDNDVCDTADIGCIACPGTIWINQTTEQAFICIKCTEKNALWKQIT